MSVQIPFRLLQAMQLGIKVNSATGSPISGASVVYRVIKGNGHFNNSKRAFTSLTDANGFTSIPFILGDEAGPGSNLIRASSAGSQGEVVFSASSLHQGPNKINIVSGDRQYGVVSEVAPKPLVVVVTDSADNPIQGLSIRFESVLGAGSFSGSAFKEVITGSDGVASAIFRFGDQAGKDQQRVEVNLPLYSNVYTAAFTLSGKNPGLIQDTKVSGMVQNNDNQAIEGATVTIEESGQATITNENGYFEILNAPVGTLHLKVDGTTVTGEGDWVTLEFELQSIAGNNNTLGMPVYLLARDLRTASIPSPIHSTEVTLPEVPGFKLEISPGSATFPTGTIAPISVSQVRADKIPMPPGSGMQPQFIISIGPAEVRFNPPAKVTFPNVDGLKAGTKAAMYSYDHDLANFVSIGTGTVSEDGSVVTSDPGFGIVKGGWHCSSPGSKTSGAAPPWCTITPKDLYLTDGGLIQTITASGAPNSPATPAWFWETDEISSFSKITLSGLTSAESNGKVEPIPYQYGRGNVIVKYKCKSGLLSFPKVVNVDKCPSENTILVPSAKPIIEIAPWVVTYKSYSVSGHTLEEVSNDMHRIRGKYVGENSFFYGIEFVPEEELTKIESCKLFQYTLRIKKINISPSESILLPSWNDKIFASCLAQKEWNAFFATLKIHENGHAKINATISDIVEKVMFEFSKIIGFGLTTESAQSNAQAEFDKLTEKFGKGVEVKRNELQNKYEDLTDHGLSQVNEGASRNTTIDLSQVGACK